jgi:hypothetical protein
MERPSASDRPRRRQSAAFGRRAFALVDARARPVRAGADGFLGGLRDTSGHCPEPSGANATSGAGPTAFRPADYW